MTHGLRGAGLALVLIGSASAATPPEAPRTEDLAAVVREIQNTCFASYPADLLYRMSGHEGPAPEDVRADPERQLDYLRREDMSSKGLFYPSLLDDLLPAFRAEVRSGRRFLDLGSGDGRVVFLAAFLGADATGIEFERTLHHLARHARRRLAHLVPIEHAHLRRGDFLVEDFSRYDILFYYAGHGSFLEQALMEKVARELHEGAVAIITHMNSTPPGLERVAAYGIVRVYRRARDH